MGREGGRKGEKHQYVVTSHTPPTGDLACNPGMCPDWELNQRPFDSKAGTQSTEPHQPGLHSIFQGAWKSGFQLERKLRKSEGLGDGAASVPGMVVRGIPLRDNEEHGKDTSGMRSLSRED